ncbi:MAG TPA: YCF48-related protein [Ignavibacteria bacterium]|nr:YCF48-related protein [Ignavibacteria bacterium]
MKTLFVFIALVFSASLANAQWMPNQTGVPYSLFAVDFFDEHTGVAVGQGGTIVRTTNGGNNWTLVYQDVAGNYWLNDVYFTWAGYGFAVGKGGIILRSTNFGATWTVVRPQTSDYHTLRGVTYNQSDERIHAVGYAGAYFTSPDGINWTQRFDINKTMHSIDFAPDSSANGRGIIAGTDGSVWRSTNAGVSWTPSYTGRYDYMNDVVFLGNDVAVICGNNGTLLRTTNWGGSWSVEMPGFTFEHLRSIDAFADPMDPHNPDAYKVTTCGDNGTILTSNDGGSFYLNQFSGTGAHLYGVSLKGFTDGVVVGEVGTGATNGFVVMTSSNGAVGISQNNSVVPSGFELNQNYPNPFNPTTKINFSIAIAGPVELSVYDINGKLVSNLVNAKLGVGNYTYDFDASNLASGTYIYKIVTNDFVDTKKMTLIK